MSGPSECPCSDLGPIAAELPAGYQQDLHLSMDDENRLWAAWIHNASTGVSVQWRRIDARDRSPVATVTKRPGVPGSPRIVPSRPDRAWLLWTEYTGSKGTLYNLDASRPGKGPSPVFDPELNIGEFSSDRSASSEAWVLAEVWQGGRVELRLARLDENGWTDAGRVPTKTSFVARPRIRGGLDKTFLLSWDEYDAGRYRVAAAFLDGRSVGPVRPASPEEDWAVLSCSVRTEDGSWLIAFSAEELVEETGGAVGHHSQIRVARFDASANAWREIDAVDIDYAMNPWLAAYVGRRRQPCLIARRGGGAWLFCEMKKDPTSMSPNLGRLWGTSLDAGHGGAKRFLAIDERCWFVLADSPSPRSELLVATKTQSRAFEKHVPYLLHRLRPDEAKPQSPPAAIPRPAFAPTQRLRAEAEPTQEGFRLFFGDPHLHSWVSGDLEGEPDEVLHFARDVGRLDFAAITDNDYTHFNEPMRADAWARLKRLSNWLNAPGRFTAFVGYEYTKMDPPETPGGLTSHRCVLYPGDDGPLFSWHDGVNTPAELIAALKGTRCLLHHHFSSPLFDLTDETKECNVEVCSGWGCSMLDATYLEKLHGLLRSGFKVGFFGGSDNHERNGGLGGPITGAWTAENTREAIFEAFQARRVFATTGLRPVFLFRVSGAFMGGEVRTSAPPEIEISVECDGTVEWIEIIRNGEVVHRETFSAGTVSFDWRDKACTSGEHFYYVHVKFAGDEPALTWNLAPAFGVHAWSSPVWVTRE